MTPERWWRIKEIYQAAAERSPEERDGYLAEACGADAGLRQEVERMLRHGSGEGPLDRPAWDGAALDSGLSALVTDLHERGGELRHASCHSVRKPSAAAPSGEQV